MQLQKLVYIAHGWHLVLHNRPLVRDEIQAWKWGPVLPRLYSAGRAYGSDPITKPLFAGGGQAFDVPKISEKDYATRAFLDAFWNAYGGYSAIELMNMTHRAGTPWAAAYTGHRSGTTIKDSAIKSHYSQIFRERSDDERVQNMLWPY